MYAAFFHYCSLVFATNDKLFQVFKWFGNLLAMSAAMFIAISVEWSQAVWPFLLYILSNAVWLTAGIMMKDKPLMGLNVFFFIVNLFAIYERT